MCFDTEKTQAPETTERGVRVNERVLRDMLAKEKLEHLNRDAMQAGGMVGRALSDSEIVAELFKYHPPTPEQLPLYAAINQAAKNFAEVILSTCPRGADRTAAIRLLRETRMMANAAVSLDGLSL